MDNLAKEFEVSTQAMLVAIGATVARFDTFTTLHYIW